MRTLDNSGRLRRKRGLGAMGAGVLGAALLYLLVVPASDGPAQAADEPATAGTALRTS